MFDIAPRGFDTGVNSRAGFHVFFCQLEPMSWVNYLPPLLKNVTSPGLREGLEIQAMTGEGWLASPRGQKIDAMNNRFIIAFFFLQNYS